MKSRAAVLVGERRIEIEEFPVPHELPPGGALLRVEGGGMCGTDVHQYMGRRGAAGMPPPWPVVLGHEPVGIIEQLSPEAKATWGVSEGDRVAVEPTVSCGICEECLVGRRQLCAHRRVYSYISASEAPSLWGAYAEYMVLLPGTSAHRIPEHIPIEDAVFFNPLAAGFEWTVGVGGAGMGSDVLLIGPGQRGLASIIALQEAGADRIIVAGKESDLRKFEIARMLGATHVLEEIAVTEQVREITEGRGVHLAIDFTTSQQGLLTAIDSCRRGGTALFVARHGEMSIQTDLLLSRDLTIKCSLGPGSQAYSQAVRVLGKGRHSLTALHTHTVGLEGVEEAIKMLAGEATESAIHVTVLPRRPQPAFEPRNRS